MKTTLQTLKMQFAAIKTYALLFGLLFFMNSSLSAGIKPARAGAGKPAKAANATGVKAKVFKGSPPPAVSYSGPQVYTQGTAISPLVPTSTGVGAPGFSTTPVILGSGFDGPAGIVVDPQGNIFVADQRNSEIKEIRVTGGTPIIVGYDKYAETGSLSNDAAGHLYYTDLVKDSVYKLSGGSITPTTLPGIYPMPVAIASDAAGNVFMAAINNSFIYKIPANGGAVTTVGSGFVNIIAVAVDLAGNLYVTDAGNGGTIYEIPVAGGAKLTIATGLQDPNELAVDSNGDVFASCYIDRTVKMIPAGGGTPVTVVTGLGNVFGIAVDALGRTIYLSDQTSNSVKKFVTTGGYFISPALPAGLSFNSSTGAISGTPTAASPATVYTVTAYNAAGSSTATVSIKVNPFTIAYSSPQAYVSFNTITPLTPVVTGGQVAAPGYNTSGSNDILGLSSPRAVAVDAAGNVYVANASTNVVEKFPAGGGAAVNIGSGYSNPVGVAVDAAGNVYVADNGNNQIKKIVSGVGNPAVIGTGFSLPTGVAVDAAGNIYVADNGNNAVKKISATDGSTVTLASIPAPLGIASDAAGNVYVGDSGDSAIKEIPVSGGINNLVSGTGFATPFGVTVDALGNVFVACGANNQVREVPVGGGSSTIINSTTTSPKGIAIDASGVLYVTDSGIGSIAEIIPSGGYYISATLPNGLRFNTTTGIISGTPTAASPATNYTVTAYNSGGSNSAVIDIKVSAFPLPVISYSTPQTYRVGTAIAALSPTNSGGPVAAIGYTNLPVTLSSGFTSAYGIATDAAGNVYVSDRSNNTVSKFTGGTGTGTGTILGSGFGLPSGIAVDAAGNLYIADDAHSAVKELLAGTTTPVTLNSSATYTAPDAVAVDAAGNVYVADFNSSVIEKIPVGGGTPTTVGSGFIHPNGVAVDVAGNVYVADEGSNTVYKVPASGGAPVAIGSGFAAPGDVAVDAAGNLYITDTGHNTVIMLPAGGTSMITAGSGFTSPVGIAADGAGNIYVADEGNGSAKKIIPAGGYFITPALPAGLTFNVSTGAISGMPTAASVATNYTITGYNDAGGSTAVVKIGVTAAATNNANLAGLVSSGGALTPVFATGTTSYTQSVLNAVSSVKITPTTTDPTAAVKVNGTSVTSGSASAAIALNVGQNVITTIVTASNGTTTKTYTLTVTRATASTNANLSALTPSKGALSPAFAAATINYTDMVTNGTTSITLTPVQTDATATATVNGTTVLSGHASGAIALSVGSNIITTIVTAQDGATKKTYTVNVIRPSTNAKLSGLSISAGTLAPVFNTNTTSYTAAVSNAASSVTVTPTVAVTGATIKVNGTTVASGSPSGTIALSVGTNTITTIVTAQDGVTTDTYTLTLTRAAASTNAGLSALTPSKGTLSLAFATAILSYTDMVTNGTTSLTLTPTLSDATATVTINGTAVVSGHASGAISLVVGDNTVTTIVTAQDGVTKTTYTVNVIRPSTNAKLSAFTISAGTLTPAFNTNTTSYTASVTNTTASIKVTPTVAVTGATIKVNGTAVTSGTASGTIALAVGTTTLTTVVTAQDGVTTDTYTLTVTRAASGENLPDEAVSVDKPLDTPLLENDGINVHQGVSPNGDGISDFLQIDNISQYPDNNLKIMNRNGQLVFEAKGYDNATKVFDGHSNKNGQMQLPGTYFYSLDYTVKGITKHKTGFLVLKY